MRVRRGEIMPFELGVEASKQPLGTQDKEQGVSSEEKEGNAVSEEAFQALACI